MNNGRIAVIVLAIACAGATFAMGACGGGVVTAVEGSCPCAVSNSGLPFTLGCGESRCVVVNGTATGYTCLPDGLTADPSICGVEPSFDAGVGPSFDAGVEPSFDAGVGDDGAAPDDATLPQDAQSHPVDAGLDLGDASSIDAEAPGAPCVALAGSGACSDAEDCACESTESCSFSCGGEGDAGPTVTCIQASSCSVGCAADCGVNCTQARDCEVNAGAGADIRCGQAPICVGEVGDSSTVDCTQAGTCVFSVGDDGTVTCTQATTCNVTVGENTMVGCTQAESCNVICTGSCSVDCTEATGCSVQCPPGSACSLNCDALGQMMTCPDGITTVCGATACP
jgi:hypothetical protein